MEKIYVPMEDIDPGWLKGAINYLRSTGQVPVDLDDRRIQQIMRGRLQRAYAHSLVGGSTAEGRAILEGK